MLRLRKSDTKHGLWLDCFSNIMTDCMDRRKTQKQQKHQDQQIYEQSFMIVMWFPLVYTLVLTARSDQFYLSIFHSCLPAPPSPRSGLIARLCCQSSNSSYSSPSRTSETNLFVSLSQYSVLYYHSFILVNHMPHLPNLRLQIFLNLSRMYPLLPSTLPTQRYHGHPLPYPNLPPWSLYRPHFIWIIR